MPQRCIIPSCSEDKDRKFFRVPKNINIREKWIKAVRDYVRDVYGFNLDVGKTFNVCEKHFRNTDFSSYIADEAGLIVHEVTVKRKRLKKTAVPHFDTLKLESSNDSTKTLLIEHDQPWAIISGVLKPHDMIGAGSPTSIPPKAESATKTYRLCAWRPPHGEAASSEKMTEVATTRLYQNRKKAYIGPLKDGPVTNETADVKKEPGGGGASEKVLQVREGWTDEAEKDPLYKDHEIKQEIVVGPVQLQPQDISYSYNKTHVKELERKVASEKALHVREGWTDEAEKEPLYMEHEIAVRPVQLQPQDLYNTGNIDLDKKTQIIASYSEGYNLSDIARETGVNRKTVVLWVRRFEREGSLAPRKRSGRPRLIDTPQRQAMVREYEQNGFIPTTHYAGLFDTSVDTVRRVLHREGLHYCRRGVKPLLTESHKRARLEFALEHLDFDWSNVIFADEKTFKSSHRGRLTISWWRRNNTRYTDVESGRVTVSMWGWMSAADPGELVRVPSRPSSARYVEVLEEAMLPTVRTVYPDEALPLITLAQHNCQIHRSRSVREWFGLHNNIRVLSWPARSPDLNPIEHLWGVVVQRWDHQTERTPEALEAHCLKIWDGVRGSNLCKNLIDSMRSRMQAVIEQSGGYTRY